MLVAKLLSLGVLSSLELAHHWVTRCQVARYRVAHYQLADYRVGWLEAQCQMGWLEACCCVTHDSGEP